MKRALLVIALAASSGCTVVGGGVGSGVTAIHNSQVESEDDWGYLAPVVIGAVVGLVVDVLLLHLIGEGIAGLTN